MSLLHLSDPLLVVAHSAIILGQPVARLVLPMRPLLLVQLLPPAHLLLQIYLIQGLLGRFVLLDFLYLELVVGPQQSQLLLPLLAFRALLGGHAYELLL